ncbi:MAG: MFS transporter [Phycisphaerae bacterium]|nr:MAG: MFS transporter [Phycisphaerae bacterium]
MIYEHPPGFRSRRVLNWFFLGLTYASYYLCRYNLGIVAPELKATLGFSNFQYGAIDAARNWAYAVGQFINGLFTDRLGGKRAMTIGAVGTAVLNIAFGWVAWSDLSIMFITLLIIRLLDGYVQAFGAPGMVKINTAWFRRRERGTFAGIFGIMINLGQMGAYYLGSLLTAGASIPIIFTVLKIPSMDWRYIFFIPPVFVLIIICFMNALVRNHPEEVGYRISHDDEESDDDPHEQLSMGEIFKKITSNGIVWIVAGAYFCTGFVRTSIAAWWVIFFDEVYNMDKTTMLYYILGTFLIPWLASAGSLFSGIVSDKLFGGKRAPVAALLYFAQVVCIVLAIMMAMGHLPIPFPSRISPANFSAILLLGIHVGCNATHSLLGTAAAMDLGGRKMAGFAAGVIDSFQYFGAGLAGLGLGKLLDRYALGTADAPTMNPTVWFASMLPWAILGTLLMTYLWLKHRGSDAAGT